MTRPTLPQALLVATAFLAPLVGGYVASDQTAIDSSAFFRDMALGQAPVFQHALLAFPACLALIVLLLQRRIQQIPHPYVAAALILTVGSLGPSVFMSSYRPIAVNVWIEWAVYAIAFLAAVSGLGRRLGPRALLAAVFVSCALVALRGIREYGDMRSIDPTWRIFAGWSNPNATAAMLTLGFFCGMALLDSKERLAILGTVLGGAVILLAIYLTGSKGATMLAIPVGMLAYGLANVPENRLAWVGAVLGLALIAIGFLKAFAILPVILVVAVTALLARKPAGAPRLAYVAVGLVLIGLLTLTAPKPPAGAAGATPGARIAAAAATQDQSSTFRLNLWKSAVALGKERPVTGWGLGSYRYVSARPGIVTSTVFAHNTYLQLFAESGMGALLLFLAFLGLWAIRIVRGASRLPTEHRLSLAAAIGGLVAILAHCLVDSDLSYFGLGLSFFLVMGAASLLAADAVAPEFIPKTSRWIAAAGVVGIWLMFTVLAGADDAKSMVRFAQMHREPGDVASIDSLARWDGEAAYLRARTLPESDQEAALQAALDLQPIPRIARYLARLQMRQGEFAQAESTIAKGMFNDPNNLPSLLLLLQTHLAMDDGDGAERTLSRMIGIEETPYLKIRALEEVVPTETYQARMLMAARTKDARRRVALLVEAVRGLKRYAEITAPKVREAAKGDPSNPAANYSGETLEDAQRKLTDATNAAHEAAALLRQAGDAATADEMSADATIFERALA